jgi:hypothetical protein
LSKAQQAINKLDKALRRVGPMSRTAYKRVTTSTGGDPLLDQGVTRTTTDTLIDPQPVFRRLGQKAGLLSGNNTIYFPDDYLFVFSPNAMQVSDLAATGVNLILKDVLGNVEILKVVHYDSADMNGLEVLVKAICRTVT